MGVDVGAKQQIYPTRDQSPTSRRVHSARLHLPHNTQRRQRVYNYGKRLLLHRGHIRRKPGICVIFNYVGTHINTSEQKIQCTFKTDIPDLGYLDGGSDRDVCFATVTVL